MNRLTGNFSEELSGNFLPISLTWRSALLIGIISASLFAAFCSFRLTAQGLYYDELHQAAASFSYTKNFDYEKVEPYMFVRARVHGLPVLNMSYSGAIKTGIYGLYLRYFGSRFSVSDWRWLGILLMGCGVFLFFVITSGRLSLLSLIIFSLLLLTDVTLVLMTRHDWGPVALAMFIRLLFIATWINGETKNAISIGNSFFLGLLVGIAAFEKLSSIVLIFPLAIVFVSSHRRRTAKHGLACMAGGVIGGAPLIILNLYSFLKNGFFVSMEAATSRAPHSLSGFMAYLSKYISLGAGAVVKNFVLEIGSSSYAHIEGILLILLIALIALIHLQHHKRDPFFRLSGTMIICYFMLAVSIYLLPKRTWVNHWIIGTPFQYAAILLAFHGAFSGNVRAKMQPKFLRVLIMVFVSALLISRLIGITTVAKALERGQASIHWDPSLSKIGHFASSRSNEAVFIAADWGLATQIFCLSNGNPNLVYELFWNYRGPGQIKEVLEKSGKKIFYLASINPRTRVRPDNTDRILRDMDNLRGWKEVPVEGEMAELRAINMRKFSYVSTPVK